MQISADSISASLIQAAAVILLAPLVTGFIKRTKCWFQRRQGPSLIQAYLDLIKQLRKKSTVSILASPIYWAAPYIVFAGVITAAFLLPHRPSTVNSGYYATGALLFVGLLSMVRFISALAAADTAGSFGGQGASRELFIGAMVEPSLAGVLLLAGGAAGGELGVSAALGAAAMAILTITETGRIPVDNPDTHLELTMIHEGMLLEYSGPHLALMMWAAQIKQLLFIVLMATLFIPDIPFGSGIAGITAAILWLAIKVLVFSAALAVCESIYAKMRLFKVPALLITSWILVALGVGASLFI